MRVTDTTPEISDWSIPITLFCASAPAAPAPPTSIIAEQDLIQIAWDLPGDNGGSSVLGFRLYMKRDAEPDYTLVLDGWEDPTVKSYSTIVDAQGNPLVAASYMFRVKARNIVGYSELSTPLSTALTMQTSHSLSTVTGFGITSMLGAVPNSVTVQSVAEDTTNRSSGGDILFLRVEQLCYVTDNYRCDLSL